MKAKILAFPPAKKPVGMDPMPEAPAQAKYLKRRSTSKGWSYNLLPASIPLVSELMASCTGAPPLPPGQALMEAGVLAFRCRKNDEPEILLVSKSRSKNGGFQRVGSNHI